MCCTVDLAPAGDDGLMLLVGEEGPSISLFFLFSNKECDKKFLTAVARLSAVSMLSKHISKQDKNPECSSVCNRFILGVNTLSLSSSEDGSYTSKRVPSSFDELK